MKNKITVSRKKHGVPSWDVRPPKDYPWRILDLLLADLREHLSEEESQTLTRIVRERDVSGYLRLGDMWGLQRIALHGDWTQREAVVKSMFASIVRKYPLCDNIAERRRVALESVTKTDEDCWTFNEARYSQMFKVDSRGKTLDPVFEEAREFIRLVIGDCLPEWDTLSDGARHGPGATTSTKQGKISQYDKYSEWPYHVTPGALDHGKRLIASDPRWLGAIEDDYRARFNAEPWNVLDQNLFWSSLFTTVNANKITTVPKDGTKDRPIAIEPTINVMLQLGVDKYIKRRLRRWGTDLTNQTKNRQLAREGSLRSDFDAPATIDLSSASDTISLKLVELLFPAEWYRYLCDLRSPMGAMPDDEDFVIYGKLSSMGNGYTFAIESLVFLAIAYGVSLVYRGHFDREQTCVFGDDIIVPGSIASVTVLYLEAAGFTVNRMKTFVEGPVRESCGTDWYRGYNIRPPFLKRQPDNVSHIYSDRNRLNWWYETAMGYGNPHLLDEFFRKLVPNRDRLIGPYSDTEFDTYWHSTRPLNKDAYDVKKHRYSYRALTVVPVRRKGQNFLFRKLMSPLRQAPVPPDVWESPTLETIAAFCESGGSKFDVVTRGKWRRSVIARTTSHWESTYRLDRSLSPTK